VYTYKLLFGKSDHCWKLNSFPRTNFPFSKISPIMVTLKLLIVWWFFYIIRNLCVNVESYYRSYLIDVQTFRDISQKCIVHAFVLVYCLVFAGKWIKQTFVYTHNFIHHLTAIETNESKSNKSNKQHRCIYLQKTLTHTRYLTNRMLACFWARIRGKRFYWQHR